MSRAPMDDLTYRYPREASTPAERACAVTRYRRPRRSWLPVAALLVILAGVVWLR